MLGMSATPIPRSLCLALLSDLKHSVLKVRPLGRPPIETTLDKHEAAMRLVHEAIGREERVFVVFPAIRAESLPSVESQGRALFDRMKPLHGLKYGILHGEIPPESRPQVLSDFIDGKTKILLCTQMIEVGIDIPAATLMVIMGPERFGLATLHQLRGRVGRGSRPGKCVLVLGKKPKLESLARLRVLVSEPDGFRIAEEDLRIRGPGHLAGVAQSGFGGAIKVKSETEWAVLKQAKLEVQLGTAFDRSYYEALGETLTLSGSLPEDSV
jgi:ATP-dependent DNA helicase RecG